MLIQLLFLVIFHTALADNITKKTVYDVDNYEEVGHHFEIFINTYNKIYAKEEKLKRFQIFWKNLENVNQLNKKYLATFGITKFSDLTAAEIKSYLGFKIPNHDDEDGNCTLLQDPTTKDAPGAYDWRDKRVVSPVRDQAHCGSCWAFSATAVIESRYLAIGKSFDLSEQQMVDCDQASTGCLGGLMTYGISKIMDQGGQEKESDYPYKASSDKCQFISNKVVATVKSCNTYNLSGEAALKELLFKEGPLSIGVYVDEGWSKYSSGIYDNCVEGYLNHGVLLVGYGTESGRDFWIIKNSWSTAWGENGYIRVLRGKNCCGLGNNISYGTVSVKI